MKTNYRNPTDETTDLRPISQAPVSFNPLSGLLDFSEVTAQNTGKKGRPAKSPKPANSHCKVVANDPEK